MTLKKLLKHFRFKRLRRRYRDLPRTKASRIYCVELLGCLDEEAFRNYHPRNGVNEIINVLIPNIDALTKKLRETTLLVIQDEAVSPQTLPNDFIPVAVDQFLTSSQGFYLNTYTAVCEFKKAALAFCEAMEPSDYEPDNLPEHQLRVLTKMFLTLQSAIPGLIVVETN